MSVDLGHATGSGESLAEWSTVWKSRLESSRRRQPIECARAPGSTGRPDYVVTPRCPATELRPRSAAGLTLFQLFTRRIVVGTSYHHQSRRSGSAPGGGVSGLRRGNAAAGRFTTDPPHWCGSGQCGEGVPNQGDLDGSGTGRHLAIESRRRRKYAGRSWKRARAGDVDPIRVMAHIHSGACVYDHRAYEWCL